MSSRRVSTQKPRALAHRRIHLWSFFQGGLLPNLRIHNKAIPTIISQAAIESKAGSSMQLNSGVDSLLMLKNKAV